jgi:acetyl-CoA acetyltransferase family protein
MRIDDTAAQVINALFKKVPSADRSEIEDVVIGCAAPEAEQGSNIARSISFLAGIYLGAGAITINRLCASSMDAIVTCANSISCRKGELFVAGGVESASHVPSGGFNPSFNRRLFPPNIPNAYVTMGEAAENIAKKYSISRSEQDKFAYQSHMKAVSSLQQKKFASEMVPIEVALEGKLPFFVDQDEVPCQEISVEALSRLAPVFVENGTVTSGNFSPQVDGVAMLLIASSKYAKRKNIKPIARIISSAVAGCEPEVAGEGPIFAVPKALTRAKMKQKDVELVELDEAFASQSIAVIERLGLDEKIVNSNGGSIAMGNPAGANGARMVTTLVASMVERGAGTGIATMSAHGGQGMAVVVELV